MEKTANVHYPTLVMIRGLPGSGKSYLATELEKRLDREHVLILAPDADTLDLTTKEYQSFSQELAKEGLDKAIHPFRWSRKMACDAISAHKIVIWNQPFTNRGIFERLITFLETYAHEHGIRLPVLLVEVELDPESAKTRIAKRKQAGGHGPSDDTFARRVSEHVSYADGYRNVSVHGEDDVAKSADTVIEALRELNQEYV